VSVRVNSGRIRVAPGNAAFQVIHVADFTEPGLRELAEKLSKNEERAVPWVAIAVPLDAPSFDWEASETPGGGFFYLWAKKAPVLVFSTPRSSLIRPSGRGVPNGRL